MPPLLRLLKCQINLDILNSKLHPLGKIAPLKSKVDDLCRETFSCYNVMYFHCRGNIQMGQKHYSQEFKDEVIRHYITGHSIAETRAKYHIAESTLFEWKKWYYEKLRPDEVPEISIKQSKQAQAHLEKLALELEVLHQCPCGIHATIDEKMEAIHALSGKYSIHVLCEALNLSRGTYYNRKRREKEKTIYEFKDEEARPLIEQIFRTSKNRFGRKPIYYKLLEMGYHISEKRIMRLMQEMGLEVAKPTYRAEHLKSLPRSCFKNLLSRNFDQPKPNLVWASDITYVKVGAQYDYICVILDLYSRKVLAYRISSNMDAALVMATFEVAFRGRNTPRHLLFHSDQGTQYTAYVFREYLQDKKVRQSFSSPGNPYDNSVCESFFHTLKKGALYHHLYATPQELEEVLDEYMEFYNGYRPHRKLGMKTPDQFEAEYFYAAKNQQK